ncbi:MAG: hypothetical protein QGG64_12575 [Candidatus Latescibacteria bacterium]|nr:hypothetical protein [Candidatus Latescibacterota bacterium]
MNTWFVLYVKELKANKNIFLFLLVLIVGLVVYGLTQPVPMPGAKMDWEKISGIVLPGFAVFTLLISMPFLLAHAYNSEWKSETHYQMFSLPIRQYKVSLAKIAAVGSMGFVGGAIVIVGMYIVQMRVSDFIGQPPPVSASDFYFLSGLVLIAYLVLVFGLVTGMEGVKYSVKQYRGLTAAAFFIGALYLFGRFAHQATEMLDFLGKIPIQIQHNHTTITYQGIGVAPFAYMILSGVMLLIIGLAVYEKRAEI